MDRWATLPTVGGEIQNLAPRLEVVIQAVEQPSPTLHPLTLLQHNLCDPQEAWPKAKDDEGCSSTVSMGTWLGKIAVEEHSHSGFKS